MKEFLEKIKQQTSSIISIDFDGVIHKNLKGFHDGTVYDDPVEGAKESLSILSEKYTLVIYTCKANSERPLINGKTGIELIWGWLKKYDMDKFISDVTDKKPRAIFYIDDKGITFKTWEQTLKDIEER